MPGQSFLIIVLTSASSSNPLKNCSLLVLAFGFWPVLGRSLADAQQPRLPPDNACNSNQLWFPISEDSRQPHRVLRKPWYLFGSTVLVLSWHLLFLFSINKPIHFTQSLLLLKSKCFQNLTLCGNTFDSKAINSHLFSDHTLVAVTLWDVKKIV